MGSNKPSHYLMLGEHSCFPMSISSNPSNPEDIVDRREFPKIQNHVPCLPEVWAEGAGACRYYKNLRTTELP